MQVDSDPSKTLVGKTHQNPVDIARELCEAWDNGLDFPPTELPKRYLRGDLAIRIEGSANQAKGAMKETAGKVTGDAKLKAEGAADKTKGKVQNAVGGVKDTIRDASKH